MKLTPTSSSSFDDLTHFAWCGLIALSFARQDGQALSPLTTHTFLNRWLITALKQKRFPKTVAADISYLLALAQRNGPGADLEARLNVLWHTGSEVQSEQSDLFRLTCAIGLLRSRGWVNVVVTDEEWYAADVFSEYEGQNALLVRKSQLQAQFALDGALAGEIVFLLTGDKSSAEAIFLQHYPAVSLEKAEGAWHQLRLTPAGKNTQ
ncbi:DUF2913 family protein [Klebsiella aerogenes]|uniref:DUF2913 family protein n=1 Tax=Klebsiella aerogenes TaxID=548 RepID=UPI001F3D6BA5|nr:DUF2913 family protein [Klebsiella aerogenes]